VLKRKETSHLIRPGLERDPMACLFVKKKMPIHLKELN